MNINYDYYKVFYYVAKYKSFSGAANALINNQPNITRMIKRLEKELGCTLFVRQRHGVSLTPEGERLYYHVSIALEHILMGEAEVARDKSLQSGIVTIAASEIALHCVLLPVLKEYRKSYSGIRIRILTHSTPQAIDLLKKGLADFAIVTEPCETSPSISSTYIRSICEVPVVSLSFTIQDGCLNAGDILGSFPLIGLGEKTSSFSFFSDYFSSLGLTYTPDVEAATADQILPMVKSDLGIGFVPKEFLDNEASEHLRILNIQPPVPDRSICFLTRRDSSLSIAASELRKMIFKS